MSGLVREIIDLVLPAECVGCGRTRAGAWCAGCRARLGGPGAVRRVWPDPVPPDLPPVYAAGAYQDRVRSLLLAHKERGALWLARPLGEALADSVLAALRAHREPAAPHRYGPAAEERPPPSGGAAPLLVVPVPSSRLATAARGHDPARRMAGWAVRELRRAGIAARLLPVLRQRRRVADQARLSADERLANLDGALAAVPGGERLLRAGPIVVVDDLVTTGASLAEAARAIEAAGGRVCGAGVVAATPRSYGSPPPDASTGAAPPSGTGARSGHAFTTAPRRDPDHDRVHHWGRRPQPPRHPHASRLRHRDGMARGPDPAAGGGDADRDAGRCPRRPVASAGRPDARARPPDDPAARPSSLSGPRRAPPEPEVQRAKKSPPSGHPAPVHPRRPARGPPPHRRHPHRRGGRCRSADAGHRCHARRPGAGRRRSGHCGRSSAVRPW